MNETHDSKGESHHPAQPTQQPQPARQKAHITTESARDAPREDGTSSSGDGVDDARFTAGVVKLYETLLQEPIPDEMLRLVDQLGKRERK